MSQENVETVRRVYAHWARGDYRDAPMPYRPDVVWTTFAGEGDDIVLRGTDEVGGYFREFFAQWRDFRIEARELRDHGDSVLVIGHQRGEGAASGVVIDMPVYAVWRFQDGRAAEILMTRHLEEALEAVAASPDR